MHELLAIRHGFQPSGQVKDDVQEFLRPFQLVGTQRHLENVARLAADLAERYRIDSIQAAAAGWLHDISAVIPNGERLDYAYSLAIDIIDEERLFPMLLHQKLSAVIARDIFRVSEIPVLDAIRCHTTLRPGATSLDQVVFLADKMAWDQPGEPPYLPTMQAALRTSLDDACLAYLDFLWEWRTTLPGPLHPWAIAARNEIRHKLGVEQTMRGARQ